MSAKKNQITLFLTLRGSRDVARKLREASTQVHKFGSGIGRAGVVATRALPMVTAFGTKLWNIGLSLKRNFAFLVGWAAAIPTATYALGRLGFKFASLAADAKEVRSLFLQAFPGEATLAMDQAIQRLVRNLGLSKSELEKHAALMAVFGSKAGLQGQELAKFADQLLWVGADLTAAYNTSYEDAMAAIKSGLSGETEPLKQFGIIMTESDLAAQSAALGFTKAYKSMSAGEKVMVRAAFIQKNLGFATGQAMREADSFGTVMRAMQASAKGWGEQLGGPLIEPFKEFAMVLMDVGNELVPMAVENLEELFGNTDNVKNKIKEFMGEVKRVGTVFLQKGWREGLVEFLGPDSVYMVDDFMSILKSLRKIVVSFGKGVFDSLFSAGADPKAALSPLHQMAGLLETIAGLEAPIRGLGEVLARLSVPALLVTAGKKGFDWGSEVLAAPTLKRRKEPDVKKPSLRKRLGKRYNSANESLMKASQYVDGWLMMKQFHFEQDFIKGIQARSKKRSTWKDAKPKLKKEYRGEPGYSKARKEYLHELDVMYGVGRNKRRRQRRSRTKMRVGFGQTLDTMANVIGFLPGKVSDRLEPTVAKNIFSAAGAKSALKGLGNLLKSPLKMLKPLISGVKAFFTLLRLNPLGLVITGITLLIGAFVAMYKNSEKLRNTLNGAWEVIKSAGAAAFQAIGSAMQWLWDNVAIPFMDWWGTTGGPGFSSAAQVAGDILADVLNNIGGVLMWLWHNVAEPAFGFLTDTAWPLLQAAFETAKPVVVEVLNAIGAGLQHAWAMGEGMFNQVKALADGIGGWFKAGWEAARPWLNNLINAMGEMGRNARMPGNMQSISDASAMTRAAMADSRPTDIQRGTGHIPHNAWGGPVKGMQPYIVGERGRELFVPETAGVIVPNHVLTSPTRVGGGRSTQITVSLGEVHVGGRLSATEGDAVARDLAERVTREVVRKLRVAQAVG